MSKKTKKIKRMKSRIKSLESQIKLIHLSLTQDGERLTHYVGEIYADMKALGEKLKA